MLFMVNTLLFNSTEDGGIRFEHEFHLLDTKVLPKMSLAIEFNFMK